MQFDSTTQNKLLPSWLKGQGQGIAAELVITLNLAGAPVVVLHLESTNWDQDPLRQALERCLKPLGRIWLKPQPGETLQQFYAWAKA